MDTTIFVELTNVKDGEKVLINLNLVIAIMAQKECTELLMRLEGLAGISLYVQESYADIHTMLRPLLRTL